MRELQYAIDQSCFDGLIQGPGYSVWGQGKEFTLAGTTQEACLGEGWSGATYYNHALLT